MEWLLFALAIGQLIVLFTIAYRVQDLRQEVGALKGLVGKLLWLYNRDAKALADILKAAPQNNVGVPLSVFLKAYDRLRKQEVSGAGVSVALPAPQFGTRELKSIVEIMAEQEAEGMKSGAPDTRPPRRCQNSGFCLQPDCECPVKYEV